MDSSCINFDNWCCFVIYHLYLFRTFFTQIHKTLDTINIKKRKKREHRLAIMYTVARRQRHRIFLPLHVTNQEVLTILGHMGALWMNGMYTLFSDLYEIGRLACQDLWEPY